MKLNELFEDLNERRRIGIHMWYIVGGDSSFEIIGEWKSEKDAEAALAAHYKAEPKDKGDFEVVDGAKASEMSKKAGEGGYYYTSLGLSEGVKYNGWLEQHINLYYVCGTFKKEKVVWDGPYKTAVGAETAVPGAEKEFPKAKFKVMKGTDAVKAGYVPFEPGMLGEDK